MALEHRSSETVDTCVHDAIYESVVRQLDDVAVHAWDGQLTYMQLIQAAGRLALHLQSEGVGLEILVPTCFEKFVWTVVSMLAVIIAGGVGVASKTLQTEERLKAIIT